MGVRRSSRKRASAGARSLSRLFCFTYCPYNDVWIAIGKNGPGLWWSTGYRARGIAPPAKNRKGCIYMIFCLFRWCWYKVAICPFYLSAVGTSPSSWRRARRSQCPRPASASSKALPTSSPRYIPWICGTSTWIASKSVLKRAICVLGSSRAIRICPHISVQVRFVRHEHKSARVGSCLSGHRVAGLR